MNKPKKELNIDWELYQQELAYARSQGFKMGIGEARRLMINLLDNANKEYLEEIIAVEYDITVNDEYQILLNFVEDMLPRYKMAKINKK